MRLVRIASDRWHVESVGQVMYGGGLEGALAYLRSKEILDVEIKRALKELAKTGHNAASFGELLGSFVCTLQVVTPHFLRAELEAIQAMRQRLIVAGKDNDYKEMHAAGEALLNLYVSLDVDELLDIVREYERQNEHEIKFAS